MKARFFPGVLLWIARITVAPALLASAIGVTPAVGAPARPLGNLSPDEALRAFETEPGFAVDLIAAEPLVVDPVALAFDERGRLFAAENRDYPTGAPDGRPLGVIAMLEDTDRDGRMDRRTEFAAGLKFPNGVMCWRGGLIVTAAPDVWWLADTNGDGRADVRELWLTGFDTTTTSQLRVNDPTLGPDGWIYFAGGLRGGKVSSPRHPGVTVNTDRGDLRFHPGTGEMEIIAGKSQYGLAFDDAGHRFACMNRIQSQHAPLPARYLERNPFIVSPGALHDCPSIVENSLMTRYRAGAARYYPISDNLTTADSHLGTYSAACAVHVYRGRALPVEYRGAAFSCDPTGNLVRGDRLEKSGGTFAAVRIHDGTEALRSRDNWFRPVFLADGPDGALYVADMYRKTIEHPDYLPGEVRRHTDFESGKDMGRIWRLRATAPGRPARTRFPRASAADLLRALASEIPWERDTAFRLLVEQGDPKTAPRLRAAFRRADETGPAVSLLQLLQMFNGLDDPTLALALRHASPGVRENGIRLAESRVATNAPLREQVLALAEDADPHVRFQVALTLGATDDPRGRDALVRIALRQAADVWTRAAIQTSLRERQAVLEFLGALAAEPQAVGDGALLLAGDLGRQLALRAGAGGADRELTELGRALAPGPEPFQVAAIAGFAENADTAVRALLRTNAARLGRWLTIARRLASASGEGMESAVRGLAGLKLLAFDPEPESLAILRQRLDSREPVAIQTAAARALLAAGGPAAGAELMRPERWNSLTPGLRTALLSFMAGRAEFAGPLLDALETGGVTVGLLTPAQRDQLRKSKDPALRTRAEKILAAVGGNRQQAFEAAKACLALKPVPANGQGLFEKHCATCHRLNQIGVAVGPDLFDIRQQPKESILYHLVLPEAEIAPNFVNYECELTDGRVLSGLLAAESGASVTLRMAQGVEESIPRTRIARLTASRLSLMPQELEKAMSLQELADLLAYLRGEQ